MTEIEQETKKVLCKHCNNTFLATKENFYTKKGKLAIDICKQCKRDKVKMYIKNKPKKNYLQKDRTEYMKIYNKARAEKMKVYDIERRKLKKEKKILNKLLLNNNKD